MKQQGILFNLFLPRTRGACMAHFRNMLQLTQGDISNELGMNRSSISKMENGDINVSENVWSYVLNLVYEDFELEETIPFDDFRDSLEQFLETERGRGQSDWIEQRLSLQPETSI
jgi:transcriptional regulator with XRE-family HTH domain